MNKLENILLRLIGISFITFGLASLSFVWVANAGYYNQILTLIVASGLFANICAVPIIIMRRKR